MIRRVPLIFAPPPEGGFTVISAVLPELFTEGDTLEWGKYLRWFVSPHAAVAGRAVLLLASGRDWP